MNELNVPQLSCVVLYQFKFETNLVYLRYSLLFLNKILRNILGRQNFDEKLNEFF